MIEFFTFLNELRPLSPETLAALMKIIRLRELRRGQVWLAEGDVCDKFSFVLKGMLKLYTETGNKEIILNFARSSEILLSAQSYFDNSPSPYSIRSVLPTAVLFMHRNELLALTERYPEFNFHLLRIAARQAALLEVHAGLLLLPPRERFDRLMQTGDWLADRTQLTDRMLAAYLGVGPNAICQWRKL